MLSGHGSPGRIRGCLKAENEMALYGFLLALLVTAPDGPLYYPQRTLARDPFMASAGHSLPGIVAFLWTLLSSGGRLLFFRFWTASI
jgi:hypothetical protein